MWIAVIAINWRSYTTFRVWSEPETSTSMRRNPQCHVSREENRWLKQLDKNAASHLYTLRWTDHFPLKIVPFHRRSWLPSNTRFLEPTQVHKPNGISIDSAVFAGLTTVTDRQTDRPTDRPRCSVYNNIAYSIANKTHKTKKVQSTLDDVDFCIV